MALVNKNKRKSSSISNRDEVGDKSKRVASLSQEQQFSRIISFRNAAFLEAGKTKQER